MPHFALSLLLCFLFSSSLPLRAAREAGSQAGPSSSEDLPPDFNTKSDFFLRMDMIENLDEVDQMDDSDLDFAIKPNGDANPVPTGGSLGH